MREPGVWSNGQVFSPKVELEVCSRQRTARTIRLVLSFTLAYSLFYSSTVLTPKEKQ